MFVMLTKKELVGHTGNVIANDDLPRFRLRKFFIERRHRTATICIVNEKFLQTLHGAVAVLRDGGVVVNAFEEEPLKLTVSGSRGIAEASEAIWRLANVFHRGNMGGQDALLGSLN